MIDVLWRRWFFVAGVGWCGAEGDGFGVWCGCFGVSLIHRALLWVIE